METPARYSCPTRSQPRLCSAPATCGERWGDAIALLQHPLSLRGSPGSGGRRTKIAFPTAGKKAKPSTPPWASVPFNASRRKSAARAFFCTAGVQSRTEPRRGPDFQAAGQPAATPNTAAQQGRRRDQSWDLLAQPKCPWLAGTQPLQRAGTLTLLGTRVWILHRICEHRGGQHPPPPVHLVWGQAGARCLRAMGCRGCPERTDAAPRCLPVASAWETARFESARNSSRPVLGIYVFVLSVVSPLPRSPPTFLPCWVARAGLSPLML